MVGISSTKPKARKEHLCNWCACKIKIGEIYRRSFNVYDGYAYTWKNHIYCENIASELNMYDGCDYGLDEDSFQEHIREEFIKLQEHHNFEVFNYEHYQYPNFEKQLKYVCEMYKII